MGFKKEIDQALAIARSAGELAMRYFHAGTVEEEKDDLSPVTIADRECEALISTMLSAEFPDDGILGEEGACRPSRSGRIWIIDPIDGTRDFVRRTDFWAIQIALESQGEIALGVIHLPVPGETCHAVKGAGCFWNGEKTGASGIDRLGKAILMISGFQPAWDIWSADQIRRLTQGAWTVRAYSGCYDVTLLARGKADIWLSGSGKPWDYAPARIIAAECGAVFLTQDGGARIDAGHCVICAPGLEGEIRSILQIPRR